MMMPQTHFFFVGPKWMMGNRLWTLQLSNAKQDSRSGPTVAERDLYTCAVAVETNHPDRCRARECIGGYKLVLHGMAHSQPLFVRTGTW